MKRGFNLLKAQAEPPSVWSKVYDWVLGTARIIIIVVEVVVLVAFVIRVIIDLQAKDLDNKITQSEAVLNVLRTNEAEFRTIQGKTSSYTKIWNGTPDYTDIIKSINASLPINTSIKDLNISVAKDSLSITGTADKAKEADIVNLETSVKNNLPNLTDSILQELKDSTDQLKFTFQAKIININNKKLSDITANDAN